MLFQKIPIKLVKWFQDGSWMEIQGFANILRIHCNKIKSQAFLILLFGLSSVEPHRCKGWPIEQICEKNVNDNCALNRLHSFLICHLNGISFLSGALERFLRYFLSFPCLESDRCIPWIKVQFSPWPEGPVPQSLSGWCRSVYIPHPWHSLATPDARRWTDSQPALRHFLVQSPAVTFLEDPCVERNCKIKRWLNK